ncbi:MAG: hypothetical protein HYU41_09375 [Candidatus Rokubacteria bacterium]|nr:hypothetical protein [Candidatus Rokubacteria bacterium]
MTELLDPTTGAATQTIAFAPRPQALAGKRIALIENTKFNSDRLLEKIGALLRSEYGAADARLWRKRNASVPAHQEIIEEVRKTCDVMVAGIGD